MASIGSSILPASGLLSAFFVVNFPITLAATEYSYSFPAEMKHFRMQMRGNGAVNIADTSGLSGTTYFQIFQGDTYEVANIKGSSTITMYLQSNKPTQILSIIYWT